MTNRSHDSSFESNQTPKGFIVAEQVQREDRFQPKRQQQYTRSVVVGDISTKTISECQIAKILKKARNIAKAHMGISPT